MLLVQQRLGHKLSTALLVENNSTGTSSFFYQLIHALNFVLSSLKIGSGFRALAALSRLLSKGIIQLAWVGTSETVTVLSFYSLNLDAEAICVCLISHVFWGSQFCTTTLPDRGTGKHWRECFVLVLPLWSFKKMCRLRLHLLKHS